jgi:hypothetical protein
MSAGTMSGRNDVRQERCPAGTMSSRNDVQQERPAGGGEWSCGVSGGCPPPSDHHRDQ